MKFRPDQTLPGARFGQRAKYRTVAAANLEKPPRFRKEFICKTDDEFVAGYEPKISCF